MTRIAHETLIGMSTLPSASRLQIKRSIRLCMQKESPRLRVRTWVVIWHSMLFLIQ